MSDAWKILNSRIGFDGRWWQMRLDQCETPAGIVIDDYPVFEYPDWVSIVALRQTDQKVILTKEYRHAAGKPVLGLPGGTVEPDETISGNEGVKAAAIRELLEETGYQANSITQIGTFLPNAATHSNHLFGFLASNVVLHQAASLDDEAGTEIGLEFVSLRELVTMIRTQEVEMESGQVAAIFAAYMHLVDCSSD